MRAGLSRNQLAKAAGFGGGSSIQRYEEPEHYTKDLLPLDLVRKLTPALVGRGDPPITEAEVLALATGDDPILMPLPTSAPTREAEGNAALGDRVVLAGDRKIPVYGQAVGGDYGEFVLNGNHVDDVLAPPSLRTVRDAYVVYILGDSMAPRYFSGEAAYINPGLPVTKDDFVCAQILGADDDKVYCFVKQYMGFRDDKLVLWQFNPAKELVFDRSRVKSIHRIVFAGSR